MKVTTHVDIEIGRRLRQARLSKGLTLKQAAQKINISYQQWQKYENGSNRVSLSKLWVIVNTLDIPITYFFDELDDDTPVIEENDLPDKVMRIAQMLNKLPDGEVKDEIFDLVKAITKAGEN